MGLSGVEIAASLLPRVLGPDEPAGTVTMAAADALGLRAGILVGPGTGDNPAAALGIGLEVGAPALSLGTSGTVYTVSEVRAEDPSGTVVGLADATGRYLPLACTLNCTLAVERVARWLGIGVDAPASRSRGVVVAPFFDGERTPDLPYAAASVVGLRHATEPGEILRATYEGAIVALLDAVAVIDRHSSGIRPDAPITLIGGGSRGRSWLETIRDLSGRALRVPRVDEPVALGAAAQAAAVVLGEPVRDTSRRWSSADFDLLEARAPDAEVLGRIREVMGHLGPLNERPFSRFGDDEVSAKG